MVANKNPKSQQGGFTLLELAVVMTIVGIMVGGAAFGYAHYSYKLKAQGTDQKFDVVMNALSAYAQRYARLPCPADPDAAGGDVGAERADGECFIHATGEATGNTLYASTQGVVPWRELGLPESAVRDGWGRYFTYKPAPQLTVNNYSDEMMDIADTGTLDVNNACRSPLWFDENNVHIDRGKALFCCNAAPKPAYLADTGQPTGLSSNWRDQAIMAAGTATGTFDQSSGPPANVPVESTNAWMDAPDNNARVGTFDQPRTGDQFPDAPLIRATGHAVTLISHGGNGFLSFLRGQGSDVRQQGNVTDGGGVTAAAAMSTDEALNVWPPQVAAATTGHPKAAGGAHDAFGKRDNASDDRVAFLRSDQVYSRLGSASCIRPAAAGLEPNTPSCSSTTYGDMSFVLDTSGSMTTRVRNNPLGNTRMEVAKNALGIVIPELIQMKLDNDPEDMIGFNRFSSQGNGCGVQNTTSETLFSGFPNFDEITPAGLVAAQGTLLQNIADANANGLTPLAATLEATADAMNINGQNGTTTKPNALIFISDGEDTCGGDIIDTAHYIAQTYPNLVVHVIDVANNPSLAEMHEPFTVRENGQDVQYQMRGQYVNAANDDLAEVLKFLSSCTGGNT